MFWKKENRVILTRELVLGSQMKGNEIRSLLKSVSCLIFQNINSPEFCSPR